MKKYNINVRGVIFDIVMIIIAILLGRYLYHSFFGENPILMILYFSFIILFFLSISFGRSGMRKLRKYEKEEKDHPITEADKPLIFRLSFQALLPIYFLILFISLIPIGSIGAFILVAFPMTLLISIPMRLVYNLQKDLIGYTKKFWLLQLAVCLPIMAVCQTIVQILRLG